MTTLIFLIILAAVILAIVLSNLQKVKHVEDLKEQREGQKQQWHEEANRAVLGEVEQIRSNLVEAIESHFGSNDEEKQKLIAIINQVLKDEEDIWQERRSWIRNPKKSGEK